MKLSDNINELVNTYHALLDQCHDALAANADQRTRDELRAAITELTKRDKAEPKPGDKR